jgi:hypothetical protein
MPVRAQWDGGHRWAKERGLRKKQTLVSWSWLPAFSTIRKRFLLLKPTNIISNSNNIVEINAKFTQYSKIKSKKKVFITLYQAKISYVDIKINLVKIKNMCSLIGTVYRVKRKAKLGETIRTWQKDWYLEYRNHFQNIIKWVNHRRNK